MPSTTPRSGPSIAADDDILVQIVRELLAQGETRGLYMLGLEPIDLPLLYGAQEGIASRASETIGMSDGEAIPVVMDPILFVSGWWKDLGFTPRDLSRISKILDLNSERLSIYTTKKRGPRRKQPDYDVDALREKMLEACAELSAPFELDVNRRGKMVWRQFQALRPVRAWMGYGGCLLAVVGLVGVVIALVMLLLGSDWGRWAIIGLIVGVAGTLALLFSLSSYFYGAEVGLAAAEGQIDPVKPPSEYPEMLRVRLRRSDRMLAVPAQAIPALDHDVWYRLYYADLPFEGYHEGAVLSLEPVPPPIRGV